MKTFCESLRKHAKNVIDFEKNRMLPMTKKNKIKSYQDDTFYFMQCSIYPVLLYRVKFEF